MQKFEHTLTTRDGVVLCIYDWRPASTPRGVLVATHGHGEYALKYTHVAQALTDGGYVFWNYDVRGHGYSGGPRGHVPRYSAYMSDLQRVLNLARQTHPGLPVFLYGHSMGGQITLHYLLERQPQSSGLVRGAILCAPWLLLKYQPPEWKVWLARALANVAPAFAQSTGLSDAIPMTHDLELKASYPQLELAHGWMSARLGMEALAAGETAYERAGEITLPLLILHGEEDGVFAFDVSQTLYDRVRSADKTIHIYPGYYHEIHNEVGRAQVFADILSWLDARS
jgi:alpha-beta hydrolase superfamily lysophospholipase